jgi:hypothetical protein
MLKASIAALVSFLIFLVLHFGYFHYFMPYEKVKSLMLTAGLGLILFLFLIYTLPSEDWFQIKLHISHGVMTRWIYPAFGVLFYGFLLLGYLEFYFTADRSITFRMLMITDKQPNHSVTKEQMSALYDVPGILDKRFEDLNYGGYFELNGDVYRLTDKGKIILRIYKVAIEELHLGTSEQARKNESNLTDSK